MVFRGSVEDEYDVHFFGLACGVPSRSHLLKVARSRSACPLFQDRPRESLVESLVRRELV